MDILSTFTSSTSTAMYKGEWTTNVLDKWTTPHEGAYRALVVALIGDYHMRVTRSDGNEAQVLAFDHESGQTVEVDLRSATVALCEGSDVHDVHNFTSAAKCVELVDLVLAGLEGPSTEVVVFGPLDLHEAAMSRQLSPGEVSISDLNWGAHEEAIEAASVVLYADGAQTVTLLDRKLVEA